MDIDFADFREFLEKYAKPRWENIEEEWPLRPGGGEVYIQEKVYRRAAPFLSEESLSKDIKSSLVKAMNAHFNLLSAFEFSFAKDFINRSDKEKLGNNLIELLYGKDNLGDRLSKFLEWSKVEKKPDTGKREGINATVCSYFLSMSDPQKYAYCKPTAYNAAVDSLLKSKERIKDHGKRIVHCGQLYSEALNLLETEYGLIEGNLLDVHSLFYLMSSMNRPERKINCWAYAPGPDAEFWEEFYDQGIMGIGWDKLGNLSQYGSKDQILKRLKEEYDHESNPKNDALTCFDFLKTMKKGDVVFVRGTKELLGWGKVDSSYIFDESRENYRNIRKVDWKKRGSWDFSDSKFALKTLTNITPYPDFISKLQQAMNLESETPNCWWLNTNPKIWNFIETSIGQTLTYTAYNSKGNKRRIFKHFQSVRPGDIVIGYVASPIREITAECKITKGLHESNEGTAFEFIKTEQFNETVSFEELKGIPELQNCEPLKSNQGSLFKLTTNEYETIRAIIDEKNEPATKIQPYSLENALKSLFLSDDSFDLILNRLLPKKNLILQGPPGVGKTFIAKHLAYATMGAKDDIGMIFKKLCNSLSNSFRSFWSFRIYIS